MSEEMVIDDLKAELRTAYNTISKLETKVEKLEEDYKNEHEELVSFQKSGDEFRDLLSEIKQMVRKY